jgi:hypothetical protein
MNFSKQRQFSGRFSPKRSQDNHFSHPVVAKYKGLQNTSSTGKSTTDL